MVHERMLVLVGGDRPCPHIAGFGQRPAEVDLRAVVVPAASAQLHVALELGGRFLADQVDGAAGATCASE
ncbi:hypothetical protein D3C72_2183930 [compost metagenome]